MLTLFLAAAVVGLGALADEGAVAPGAAALDPRLPGFISAKEQQARALAARAGIDVPADFCNEVLAPLQKAIELSADRLKRDPKARNLLEQARQDPRFNAARRLPDFEELLRR